MSNKRLIGHIKKYTTFEWLVFIKILENKSDDELLKLESNQMERYNLQNSNWYSKLLDLVLRLSDYEKTKVKLDTLPRAQDYRAFIKLYLESYDSESDFKADLDYSLDLAFTKYLYEQNKHYAPPVNSMGRLIYKRTIV
jgi:adenylate kinase family enzyme